MSLSDAFSLSCRASLVIGMLPLGGFSLAGNVALDNTFVSLLGFFSVMSLSFGSGVCPFCCERGRSRDDFFFCCSLVLEQAVLRWDLVVIGEYAGAFSIQDVCKEMDGLEKRLDVLCLYEDVRNRAVTDFNGLD